VFFQIVNLVGYFHCRHPSVLSKSPAGSASVSFEPKEIQVPERLKMFLYGMLSRIRCPFCFDVAERDRAFSSNDLEELLPQITEIMLDTVILHRNKLGFDDNLRLDLAQFAGDLSTRTIRDFLTESGHPRRSPIPLPT
jgi:hypothetical protein